jgi:uncharacterized protein with HEPN domain
MLRDEAWLLDMLVAARKVRQFVEGIPWQSFRDDEVLQNAVMHQIQIIGEAARNVSEPTRAAHAQIPWPQIVGMRNRLVHNYFRILPERVWEVVTRDIDPLIVALEPLVPPDPESGAPPSANG